MRWSIASKNKNLRKHLSSMAYQWRLCTIRKTSSSSTQLSNVNKMNYSSNYSFSPAEANSKELDMGEMKEIASAEHSLTMTSVCSVISLLSFVGNLLLCVVILKRRSMLAKPYNVLIFNLAVTDMLTGKLFTFLFIFILHTS